MTEAVVVDASAFIAVMLDEPEGPNVMRRLEGLRYVGPLLVRFEVANSVVTKSRRRPESTSEYVQGFENFMKLKVEIVDIDFPAAIALAQRRSLTAYDASYAWLALSLNLDLVTLDKRLIAAFEAERNARS